MTPEYRCVVEVAGGGGGGGQRDAIALKPPKADVRPVGKLKKLPYVAVALRFEMVVSAGKVADLQRAGIHSSLGKHFPNN